MRILFINEVCGHTSTGKICAELAKKYAQEGHEVIIGFGRDDYVPEDYKNLAVRIGTDLDVRKHALLTRLTDKHGLGSVAATKAFLNRAEKFNPDLVWLHNIHGYYINYELLFTWLKNRPRTEVKWTLHDCWAFTGHCSHYTFVQCEKWKTGCHSCAQKNRYPTSWLMDNSSDNYARKKKAFTGVNHLTIITPSQWLKNQVKESFLKEYPVEVIHNTANPAVFHPTRSDFREKYGLQDKTIILGVANVWDDRKGLGTFLELAKRLKPHEAIVLVGLTPNQIRELPSTVLGLEKTNNAEELAGIYSAADIYFSPSVEETFGMTVLEAIQCGTPVVVYQGTACEEVIQMHPGMGYAIQRMDLDDFMEIVSQVTAENQGKMPEKLETTGIWRSLTETIE